MIYNVTNDFIAIGVTGGTIQNNSYVYPVEVSDSPTANSGYILHPLNKMTFSGTKLYMRCTDGGAWAEIRVVPFFVDGAPASTGSDTPADNPTEFASDTAAENIIDDAWNGVYDSPADSDSVIDGMWNSSGSTDTGDGFSDYLDGLFSP